MKKTIFKKLLCLCIAVTLIVPMIHTPGAKVEASTSGAEGRSFTADELYCVKQPYESEILTYEASIWIPTALTEAGGVIVGTRGGAENCYSLVIDAEGNPHLYLQTDSDTSVDYEFTDVNVKTGKWVHMAVVKDASASKLYCYVDGVQKQELELTDATSIIPDVAAVVGGDYTEGNTNYFKGHIRDIKLYPEARTAEEIVSDMNSLNEAELAKLQTVTFEDFSVVMDKDADGNSKGYKEYAYIAGDSTNNTGKVLNGKTYTAGMSGKVLGGDIEISSAAVSLLIESTVSSSNVGRMWLMSGTYADDPDALKLRIRYNTNTTTQKELKLTPEIAGTALVNNKFNFKLSYQTEDKDGNGTDDCLKLGVWINEKLYNNQYFYWEGTGYDSFLGSISLQGRGAKEGAYLRLYSSPEELDEKMETVTFEDFSVVMDKDADGNSKGYKEYAYIAGDSTNNTGKVLNNKMYTGGMSDKVLGGDIEISSAAVSLLIESTVSSSSNGKMWLMSGTYADDPDALKLRMRYNNDTNTTQEFKLTPEIAGTALVNNKFNFKLSYQTEDKDGNGAADCLKLGVWINEKLYNNQYFYWEGTGYDSFLGSINLQGRAANAEGKYIRLYSSPEELDDKMETVTFEDFSVVMDKDADGNSKGYKEYAYIAGDSTNNTGKVLNNKMYTGGMSDKVLGGDIEISSAAVSLLIESTVSSSSNGKMWLMSGTYADDPDALKLRMRYNNDTNTTQEFKLTPEIAGTALVNNKFNFKLSYQTEDKDGNGTADCLKLGVWINEKLYNNQYFYWKNTGYDSFLGSINLQGRAANAEGKYLRLYAPEIAEDAPLANFDLSGTETDAALVKVIACNDITQYRTADAKNVPTDITPSGYIFAGWYKDAMCKTSVGKDEIGTQGTTYYAKFVNEKIWKVQAQIDSKTTVSSTSTSMRFLTTIDSLQYQQAGFYVDKGNESNAKKSVHKTAYRRLQALGFDYTPDAISSGSTYFIVLTIPDIPQAGFETEMGIRPYWITIDGTEVKGARETKSVMQGL